MADSARVLPIIGGKSKILCDMVISRAREGLQTYIHTATVAQAQRITAHVDAVLVDEPDVRAHVLIGSPDSE